MTRPLFLQRLSGRIVRCAIGIQREPVHHATERDFELSLVILGFTAGACAMGLAMLVIVTFMWRPICQ